MAKSYYSQNLKVIKDQVKFGRQLAEVILTDGLKQLAEAGLDEMIDNHDDDWQKNNRMNIDFHLASTNAMAYVIAKKGRGVIQKQPHIPDSDWDNGYVGYAMEDAEKIALPKAQKGYAVTWDSQDVEGFIKIEREFDILGIVKEFIEAVAMKRSFPDKLFTK